MSKLWRCPQCLREHESEDDVVFSVCQGCLSEMKVVEEKGVENE